MKNRYCFALDLVDDPELIKEYEHHHRNVWPVIEQSFVEAGIVHLDIYRVTNRLFMIMEVDDTFTFERKEKMDLENPRIQEWERLMWKYQQALPGSMPGQKWRLMDKIYEY